MCYDKIVFMAHYLCLLGGVVNMEWMCRVIIIILSGKGMQNVVLRLMAGQPKIKLRKLM